MNPTGNQMMAVGVPKAFGLSPEEIAPARKERIEAPPPTSPGSEANQGRN